MKKMTVCLLMLFAHQSFAVDDSHSLSKEEQIEVAIKDLSHRLEKSGTSEVTVSSSRNITWRSGALGCPKPNMQYTQALVSGMLILLKADGKTYRYHSKSAGTPFYCHDKFVQMPSLPDSAL